MNLGQVKIYLWVALSVLVVGSFYLIYLGYRVGHFFADSIVGKLVKTLVVVFIIEMYSLGVVCYVLIRFYPQGVAVLFPIVLLWVVSLGFAIFAVRSAQKDMMTVINK